MHLIASTFLKALLPSQTLLPSPALLSLSFASPLTPFPPSYPSFLPLHPSFPSIPQTQRSLVLNNFPNRFNLYKVVALRDTDVTLLLSVAPPPCVPITLLLSVASPPMYSYCVGMCVHSFILHVYRLCLSIEYAWRTSVTKM